MLTLAVKPRDSKESAESVRASGMIPAVFYGPKESTTAVSIDARELEHAWKSAGHTSVVTLTLAGDQKDTLIHDVQTHPVTGRVLHADFYVLEKGKKVTIAVPLEFVGQAPAEKAGHILVKALHEVEIEVAPAELPHTLPVDISGLENVGDQISAADIKLPASATLITEGGDVVVSVTAFVEEKIDTEAPVLEVAEATQQGAPEAGAAEGEEKAAE